MSGVNAAPAVVVNEARAVEPNGGQDVQPKKEFKFCTRLIPFTADWTIKNFDEVIRTGLDPNQGYSFVPYLQSSYLPPDFPWLHFKMEVRPWGYNADHRNFVSMILFLTAPSSHMVLFDLSLINEKGETKYKRRINKRIKGTGVGVGVYDYIRRAELLDKDSELLGKDGSIRVRFEGTLVLETTECDARLKKLLAIEMSGSQTMRPLYESLEFTDVTLKVGASPDSEKEFKAHRAVLCKRSPVFAEMFKQDMKEPKESVTNINDITPDVFGEMLKYMYTGELPKLDSIAMELFEAADRYQLFKLKEICEEALCLQMEDNTQTIKALLKFNRMAKRHSSKKMEEKSLAMLQKQARDIFEKVFVAPIITEPDLEAHLNLPISIYVPAIAPPSTNPEANASRQPTVANRNNSKRARQS